MVASKRIALRRSWKIHIVFWCFFGTLLFLYNACLQNSLLRFYAGLAMNCLLILACKLWFRPPQFVTVLQNTVILVLIGLPIADLFVRPPLHTRINEQTDAPYYFCESSTHPGTTYQCWFPLSLAEWERMQKDIVFRRDGQQRSVLPISAELKIPLL